MTGFADSRLAHFRSPLLIICCIKGQVEVYLSICLCSSCGSVSGSGEGEREKEMSQSSSKKRVPKRKREENGDGEGDCKREDVKRAKRAGKIRRDKDGMPIISVALTGAHEGAILSGIHDDSKDTLLKVVKGAICSVPCFTRNIDEKEFVRAISRKYNISHDAAEQRIRMFPAPEEDRDNAHPLGRVCRHQVQDKSCECEPEAWLQILQPGALQQHADDAGFGEQMEHAVRTQRTLTWRDILMMMGRKTLVLRPRLYEVVVGPTPVSNDEFQSVLESGELDIVPTERLLHTGEMDTCKVYSFNGKVMPVPPSADREFTSDDVVQACIDALGSNAARFSKEIVEMAQVCKSFSLSVLKSMLQKAARYGATNVELGKEQTGLDHDIVAPTYIFNAVVAASMFACKGAFSPELQLFTRGCTAAFKRIAVTMVEDAWPTRGSGDKFVLLCGLLGYALITQRMTQWNPPLVTIHSAILAAASMSRSRSMLKWHNRECGPHVKHESVEMTQERIEMMRISAELLETIKSFKSDIDMFHKLAKEAECNEKLPMLTIFSSDIPETMPLCHGVDHHAFRGFGHIINPIMTRTSFKACFRRVFDGVTGQNARIQFFGKATDEVEFEKRWHVRATRYAQREILRLLLCKNQRATLDVHPDGEKYKFSLSIDPGTLAACVGPIPITVPPSGVGRKKTRECKVLVILGITTPEEEVVMLPPTERNPKDLYGGVSDEQARQAIQIARESSPYTVNSPLLGKNQCVKFDAKRDRWCIAGEPWSDVCKSGFEYSVPTHPDPWWSAQEIDAGLLGNDDAISDSIKCVGSGACESADEILQHLKNAIDQRVVQRARTMLVQQYDKVAMPVPNLKGGQHSDQLMAYDGDWNVFRFLVLVSRLYPGALRLESVPCFSIPNPALLRHVEHLLDTDESLNADDNEEEEQEQEQEEEEDYEEENTKWGLDPRWQRMEQVCDEQLMEHQTYAVERMLERDKNFSVPGHFLVMDTGLGKTHTSLCYFYKRLTSTTLGHRIKYIVWVAPKATVEDLILSIAKTTQTDDDEPEQRLPACHVPRPTSKDTEVKFKPYHVNVVDSDYMRVLINLNLLSLAAECVVVFDEVDTMYEPTQRTSACRQLAKTCAGFVAQTATPMSKNEAHLASWLADTESYPVDKDNYLVAASGMVSLQISLSIAMVDKVESVPLDKHVRKAIIAYPNDDSNDKWMRMAKRTQHYTDKAMCDVASKIVKQDLKKHPEGGVLMVADNAKHAERLVGLMNAKGISSGLFEELANTSVHCVVVTKKQDRGYNGATRLRAIVKGVYAGNGASRHQMRGRIRRIGQKRSKVLYVTVVMENTILELLHKRQQHADTLNISLQELAREFEESVVNRVTGSST